MPTTSLSQLPRASSAKSSDLIELSVRTGQEFDSMAITVENLEKSLDVYKTVNAASGTWNSASGSITGLAPKRRTVNTISSQAVTLSYDATANDDNNTVNLVTYSNPSQDCEITLPTGVNAIGYTATFTKNLAIANQTAIRLLVLNGGKIGSTSVLRSIDRNEYFSNVTVQCVDGTNYAVLSSHGTWSNV